MNKYWMAAACAAALMVSACSREGARPDVPAAVGDDAAARACPRAGDDGVIRITDGLVATITKAGYGRAAEARDHADVHTTLWLYDETAENGRGAEIWSSGDVDPFRFQLDSGQVIRGWDLGVRCMLVGETRELRIAPELGYGARGKPPVPPNATLLFEIELLRLTAPE